MHAHEGAGVTFPKIDFARTGMNLGAVYFFMLSYDLLFHSFFWSIRGCLHHGS